MKVKLITFLIIAANLLLLSPEMPSQVLLFAFGALVLSWPRYIGWIRNSLKVILLFGSLVFIKLYFPRLISTESAVSFLLILSALKAWELDEDSDHFNMFFILALCECGIYLLVPSFTIFAFGLLKMIFYFYYIMSIRNYDVRVLNFKRVLLLTLPAILFSLLLFFTFPRFTQGFVNTGDLQAAYSGASTSFDFRNLGALNPSSEQVFRIYGLENGGINPNLVYWRSHILWEFKNQEWKGGYHNLRSSRPELKVFRQEYKVEMLQRFKEFLPTLDGTSAVLSPMPTNYFFEGTYRLKVPTRSDLTYEVKGIYGERQQAMNDLMFKKGLKINSEKIDLIKARFFKGNPEEMDQNTKLKYLVQSFKARHFKYSLNPPLYSSLEDFMLKGEEGYCTHFAAAFALLARSIQMPSRIVIGYLGGEVNPYDGSVIVREQDAHAWTEVYLSDRGWVRIDPTGLVVPMRLQMNARDFFRNLNPYLEFFNIRIQRSIFESDLLRKGGFLLDTLNSKFAANLFNLDRDEQAAILRRINPLGLKTGWFFTAGLILFLIGTFLLYHYISSSGLNRADQRYKKFIRTMKRRGVIKQAGETATQFQEKCLSNLPDKKDYILRETAIYNQEMYEN